MQRPMMPPGMPGPPGMIPGGLPPHPPGSMAAMGQQMPRPQGPQYQGMMGMQQQQQQPQQLPPEQMAGSAGPVHGTGVVCGVPSGTGVPPATMTSSAEANSAALGPTAPNTLSPVVTTATPPGSIMNTKSAASPVLSKPGVQLTPAQSAIISTAAGGVTSMVPPSPSSQMPPSTASGLPTTTNVTAASQISSLPVGQTTITTTSSVQSGAAMSTPTTVVSSQAGPVTSVCQAGQAGQQQAPMVSTSVPSGPAQSLPSGPGGPQSGQHPTASNQQPLLGPRGKNHLGQPFQRCPHFFFNHFYKNHFHLCISGDE